MRIHLALRSTLAFVATKLKLSLQIALTLKRARLAALIVCLGLTTAIFIAPTVFTSSDSLPKSTNTNSASNLAAPLSLLAPLQGPPDPCSPLINKIACENSKTAGVVDSSEWDISGAGDPSIQGFATEISVNHGETVEFKIKTDATDYRLDIYRMGYYSGLGARKIATVQPSVVLPQNQSACLTDPATGLIDCGNWVPSASWSVPADAVSGIYFAKVVREDTGPPEQASHIVFIVRDDNGNSDLLFQTSDTTWQAYNDYGGNSLYTGGPGTNPGRAYKVSYNRPFNTRALSNGEDWFFNAEYPMLRWLEANGYDVSYFTGVDSDRRGAEIKEHKVFLSVGHDEYWSGGQRANVEAARNDTVKPVHLAFFSGNESFWKTRWEASIDPSGTPYRTLVSYKETHANAKIDPLANVWTGSWRDPRFSPPADGGRPENALSGTIATVNGERNDLIAVPQADGRMRFWRNTTIATLSGGATATLPQGTLGYEWDEDLDNGSRPAGLFRLSTTTLDVDQRLQDFGSTFGSGTATHNLTLYRAASGALVFGSGTVQWSWGLDGTNPHEVPSDPRMQQATVNLFADMGNVQPRTLQTDDGVVAATPSTDTIAPASAITSPANNATVQSAVPVTITGTAVDAGGGVVGGVEVSVDSGATWHPATTGRESWSYEWTPGAMGSTTIKCRAVDDSGNLSSTPTTGPTVNIIQDATPPTVTSVSPANNATSVITGANVTATFSEGMSATTINTTTFELRDTSNNVVQATVTYNNTTKTATLDPTSPLAYSSTYTATVKGGLTDPRAKDPSGNALANNFTWSFTTVSSPAEGPGGPILVVASPSQPFSRYYAEILRAEGLNEFAVNDLPSVSAATLAAYDVVILGEMPLNATQVTMFTNWVNAGGNLIAMRPDKQLATLLGLTDAAATRANAYLKVDTSTGPGVGIVNQTIQYHGTADRYLLNGASPIATLYSNSSSATANPAVTLRSVGTIGGQAASFTFDLARSIVYTRQGNPAWDGQERDGTPPTRSDDLFFGAKSGDVQTDWVNLNKVSIPQADEQQRLLVNLILEMNRDKKPLPHFWYLPRGERAVVIMTGDDHANGGTAAQFDKFKAVSPLNCSVANWECVRATSYIYTNTPLSNAQATAYNAEGFELGQHINTGCADWASTPALESFYSDQLDSWAAKYLSVPRPLTNRTHCVVWSDYATQPVVELNHGIRLDTNYYYYPTNWVQNRPGFFTGSGIPMRFTDLNGAMIDVYQATTQMTDESGQGLNQGSANGFTIDTLLDNAVGSKGYYGVFTANMHTDTSTHAGADAIVASAQARGVPVIAARQMLEWLDGRNNSSFGSLVWNSTNSTLSFTITVAAGANGLQAMLPTQSTVGLLSSLKLNGTPINFTNQTIKGVAYATFTASAGSYEASYVTDVTGPVISSVVATPNSGGTATITWTTDEVSDSRVDYGTNPGALTLNATSSALDTSHSISLMGLSPNTIYYYRVRSTDVAGNASTSPVPPNAPNEFTTLLPAPTFTDTTASDFNKGTPGNCAVVTHAGNGEVILTPFVGEEFSGSTLPSGWSSTLWTPPGGSTTIGGGVLTVSGTKAGTDATFAAGRSLEFSATFSATAFQHIGFGTDFNAGPWAMFGTSSSSTSLFARTSNGGPSTDTVIPGSWLGASHRYRIEWTSTSVIYSIDGVQVASHAIAISTPMRPLASDFDVNLPALAVDWLRLSPYATPCTFDSQIFDAGQSVTWNKATWSQTVPAGTSLGISVRTGDTSTPDGSWTGFTTLASSGAVIGGNSRYIQYRADLAATDITRTPELRDLTLDFLTNGGTQPPVANNDSYTAVSGEPLVVAAPGVLGNDSDADGNPIQAILVSGPSHGALTLNANGSFNYTPNSNFGGTDTFTYKAKDPTLLESNVATVTIAVHLEVNLIDTTVPNFTAGTPGVCTLVAGPGDGEVILAPTLSEEFSGSTLPGGWSNTLWSGGGSTTVSAGSLTLNGSRAGTVATYAAGRSLEFVATFGAAAFQHAGFGVDYDNVATWAMFSTSSSNTTLSVRTNNGSSSLDAPLAANLLGTPHRYRIEWSPTGVTYFVDGVQVASHAIAIGVALRPLFSDFNVGGGDLSVDWLRMGPYATSCTFDSRIFNAGQIVTWDKATWTSETPAGTILLVSVRTGNTPTPDGTWTGFNLVANSGATIGASGQYIQYRADLATSDPGLTPVLKDVTLTYSSNTPNQAPVAANDSYSIGEDGTLTPAAPGVLGNDTDLNSDPLTAILVTGPANGTLALNANGSFSYTPNANFNGADSFTYKANDGTFDSNVATVAITVNAVNDAPVAVNDAHSVNEDTPLNISAPGVLSNDIDADGNPLTAVLVAGVTHGTLTLNANGSFTYTPATNYNGPDSFTYKANDGTLDSGVATVAIAVNAVNDAPVAANDAHNVNEDITLNIAAPGVLGNDTDVDGNPLAAVLVTGVAHGTLTLNTTGAFTYTPAANYNGPDSFTYKANDGTLDSNVATVSITVNAVNDAPTAVNDSYSVNEDTALTITAPLGVLANDSDPEGTALTAVLVSGVAHGSLTLSANGSFTYTPATNYNGPDSFTYKANDGTLDSNVATVSLTVNAVNDAPVAVNDAYTATEDTTLNITAPGVLGNDTDADGNPLAAVLVTGVAHGTLTLNANGSFAYTPAANYNGADSFTYKTNDGTLDSNLATVAITVNAVNDAPTAVNDSYSVNEDATLTIIAPGVLGNDTDPEASTLTAVLGIGPAHGTLTLNATGAFTYTPAANYNGPDSFTYKANDGTLDSNLATVSLNVNPVNDAPVAVNDAYTATEDTTLNINAPGVLGNDTDADANPLTAVSVTGPAHGTLTLNANGSFTYTPAANYNGADSFTYKANDGTLDSNVATVAITVNAVNDAPSAVNDSYSVNEDATLTITAPGVLSNDTDVDGNPLTAALVTSPTHGTLTLNATGAFTYTPAANYNGPDNFTYKANDGSVDSNVASVAITVTAVNDAPTAVDDSYSVNEDATLTITAPGVLSNDTDPDGNPLTAVLVTGVAHGTLTLNANGSFTYTPAVNYNGIDSFTYRANDGTVNSGVATVTITVNGVNDAPVAVNDAYNVNEDTTLNISAPGVLSNDTDVDANPLTAVLGTGPAHGTLTLNATGSFSYTPAANYNGPDNFTYKANDGTVDSNVATVSITVNAVNDAPTAINDSYSVNEDATLTITAPGVLSNDSDPEGSTLTAVLGTGPAHGTLTLNATGAFTYTPAANYNGPDSFTYKANDGSLDSGMATVALAVNAVNDAPVAVNDAYNATEDTTLNIAAPGVLSNDNDADGNPLTSVLVTGVSHGTLTLNATGAFTYTPATNYNGTDSFTYKANDGTADSGVATVTITVNSANDAPVAVNDTASTNEDLAVNINVLANDTDSDSGDTISVSSVTQAAHGAVAIVSAGPDAGKVSYTPAANYNGPDSFTYKAKDSSNAESNVATVTVTVNPVNDAPTAVNDNYSVNEDATLTITAPGVLSNDSDPESSTLTAVLGTGPAHGTLTLNANGSFTYTPAANYNGPDSFTYKANDGTLDSSLATVSLTVNPVNDAPTAVNDSYSVNEDATLTITAPGVLSNDSDPESSTLTAVPGTGPAHGTLTLNANGSFTYTPAANYNGPDSFTYKANDGALDSNLATVTITVGATNDAPVAVNDTASTNEDVAVNINVLANDTDPDSGDTISVSSVTQAAHGTVAIVSSGPDAGKVSYTPATNYNGPDSFTYRAKDSSNADSNVATVTVTVNGVNDAPTAVNDSYSVNEDATLTISAPGVLTNDTDTDGNPLTAVLVTGPTHGTLTLNANGSFTYTPAANHNGPDSFTYKANDGTLDSNNATVSLTVNPVNDAPTAANDAYSANEDTPLNIAAPGVLSNDTDADGNPLTAVLVTGVAHGTLTLNANGSFTYTPATNYSGSDTFSYKANDGTTDSGVATVTITVNGVNDAPVAVNDAYNVNEDTTLNISAPGVLSNDTDVDANPLTAVLVTGPAHGSLTLNGTGAFSYTPAANYNGPDGFTYKANDGNLDSNVATVAITVNAVNDNPTISDITNQSTNEDTATSAIPFTVGDAETAASALTLTGSSSNTTLVPNANIVFGGSGANRTVTVTPASNQSGTTTITVTVTDANSGNASDTFVLTVTAVNDNPTISDITNKTTNEDTATSAIAFTIGDLETAAASLTLSGTSSNTTLVPNTNITFGGSGANRTVTITPASNQSGTTTITVTVTDTDTGTASDTFVLTVTAVNDPPTANNDVATTIEDTAVAIDVRNNDSDADGDTFTVTSVTQGAHGAVAIITTGLNTGKVSYTPATNYNGSDSFGYTISDGQGGTASATVNVTITAANDAPLANDQSVNTNEDTAKAITLSATDVDGDTLNYSVVTSPAHGSLSGTAPNLTYTPDTNYNGPDSFTFKANDGTVDSNIATVSITVTAVNDNPTISDITNQNTNEDTPTSAIPFTVGDGETAATALTLTGSSSNTTLVPNANISFGGSGANRTVITTPASNQSGTTTITVTVTDANGGTSSDTFVLTVNSVNDNPTISDITDKTTNEDTATNAIAFTVGDVETAAASLTLTGTSSNTTLVPNANIVFGGSGANRTVTITPASNQSGATTITVVVTDADSGTSSDTFVLTVTAVNDNPTISDIANQTTNEDTATNAIAFTVGDSETAAASLTLSGSSSNTTLVPNANITFGGSGANRTVTITPVSNQSGTSTITVTVTDTDGGTSNDTFVLTVTAVNDNPTISDIASQTTNEDTATNAIAFTIGDVESAAASLTPTGTSSNTTLVPNANITFGGSGANRTVTVTPASNQSGTTTITVTVTDTDGGTSNDTFLLTVTAVNDIPTISDITNKSTTAGTASGPHSFTVGDAETPVASLTLSGSSSNTTLVPNANIVFGGSGANRTVTVAPAASQSGTATITVTVTDSNSGTASDTFVLTVTGASTPSTTSTPTTSLTPSTYGQAVTFSSTVTGSGGTPTGTVEFFDTGISLGVSTLSGGTASLVTTAVAAGTRSITAVYSGNSQFATSTSAARTQTVNKAATTSTLTLSNSPQQYSDLETFKVTITGVVNGQLPAQTVTFKVGTQVVNTVPMVLVGSTAEGTLIAPLLDNPFGSGQMKPTPLGRSVTATLNAVSPNYTVANASRSLIISKDDVRASHTGPTLVSTASATTSTATVTLSATVKDISVTPEAGTDNTPGDVRNATVTFVNRDTGASISPAIAVTLPNSSDTTIGTVSYSWAVDIGAASAQTFRVGILVDNYYTRFSQLEDGLITVAKPIATGFTAGGGLLEMLTPTLSGGLKLGDAGSRNEFGFGITYTGGGASPAGYFNAITRSAGKVYITKGTSFTLLSVVGKKATYKGPASIFDISTGSTLVDGSATFEVAISDNGEPGSADTIAITIKNGAGQIWFSSNWDSINAKCIEQLLGSGNLKLP